MSPTEAVRDAVPHELPVHELLVLLETDLDRGLSTDEARRRLQEYGPNELPHAAATGPVVRLLRQMHNPLIYVLLVSGAVTVFLGEYVDAAVILGVVLVNTVVGFVQESRAESALDALRSMVRTEARVLRDGAQALMPSTELVPGDVVLVEAGDKLPADLRLVAHAELQADESALTGESVPVAKDESAVPLGTQVADRHNMLYSGTFVTSGTGSGVVVATGADTELGEIHRLVGSAKGLATPLTRKLARFSAFLTLAILVLAGLTFAIGVARGEPAAEMFTAAVALAVGAIPEGLPAAVTVTLAIGVSRMARRGAVIRRLPAAETLGGATVICTDKTGTLTENRMTVLQLWTSQGMRSTEHPDGPLTPAERWTLVVGANCNDSRLDGDTGVGDPTETAMLAVAAAHGVVPHELPRLAELPFSSDRQYMATTHSDPASGETVLLVKGGVERVLTLCDRQMDTDGTPVPLAEHAVDAAVRGLAADGMRVLATAVGGDGGTTTDLGELAERRDLVLTGLHAMLDPPRSTAADAVRSCRTAGLSVKMITGDHAATAEAIARQVGVLDDEDGVDAVLTGDELRALPDADLPDAVERAAVFARVTPEQKLRLVEALQSRDHVVAMTGDGVNDAPALKQADIGIAMGLGGTEVAKEAGDMVLTDDDFATIEAAVEEGRGVFDNLTKFIVWTLPTNTGEALVILVAIVLGATLPILPTQILWINMTTAVALGLTLAWEPREPGIMTRPPRDPRRSLLTGPVLFRTLLVSVLLTAGAWWVFELEGAAGASVEASRTAAVNVFVMAQLFYLFSCRSLDVSVWRIGLFTNRVLLVGVAVQLLLQALFTYLPAMNALFDTAPIGLESWGRIILVAAAVTLVAAVDKRRVRGRLLT